MQINLGDVARDTITGFTGVVVSRTEYLQGCRRLSLQPQALHEGKPIDWVAFDEPQLELVEARGHTTNADTGGPRPVPGERHRPEGRSDMVSMDDSIRVPMNEAEKAEAGERCGSLLAQLEAAKASRTRHRDEAAKDIRRLETELEELGKDIREGRIEKRQGDLFHSDALPPAQATQTLGEVHRRAGKGDKKPLPTDVHIFAAKRDGLDECTTCESSMADPVHRHAFKGEGDVCITLGCGFGAAHIVHAPADQVGEAVAPDVAAAASGNGSGRSHAKAKPRGPAIGATGWRRVR